MKIDPQSNNFKKEHAFSTRHCWTFSKELNCLTHMKHCTCSAMPELTCLRLQSDWLDAFGAQRSQRKQWGSSLACFGHHFRDPEPTDPWKSFASVGTGVRKRSGPCFEHLKSSLFAWPFWRSPQTRTYRFHHRHDLESDRTPHKVNRQQLIHMQWKKIVSANCAEIAAFPPGKHTLGTQG